MTLNKKTIEWHEAGHQNHAIHLTNLRTELEAKTRQYDESVLSFQKKERQLTKALKLGLTEFDENQANMKDV